MVWGSVSPQGSDPVPVGRGHAAPAPTSGVRPGPRWESGTGRGPWRLVPGGLPALHVGRTAGAAEVRAAARQDEQLTLSGTQVKEGPRLARLRGPHATCAPASDQDTSSPQPTCWSGSCFFSAPDRSLAAVAVQSLLCSLTRSRQAARSRPGGPCHREATEVSARLEAEGLPTRPSMGLTACLLAPWGPCPSPPQPAFRERPHNRAECSPWVSPADRGRALPLLPSPAARSSDTAWGPPPVATVGLAGAGTAVSTQGARGEGGPDGGPLPSSREPGVALPAAWHSVPRSARAPGSGVRDGQTPDACLPA